jgi:hypothetical protein
MPTDNDDDAVRLSLLVPRLLSEGWEPLRDYRTLWLAALNGEFPAHQLNGRWHFRLRDIPAIARALKLRRRPGPRTPSPERSVAA